MPTIPDSNIFLDLLYGVEPWAGWSRQWYAHCADEAAMITNAVIVAEATPVSYTHLTLPTIYSV